ncbi:hypothetical protein GCM10022631_28740 [Deinococcus rubellus]
MLAGMQIACEFAPSSRSVAAQILSFNTRVAALQTAVQVELLGQPGSLGREGWAR